jgi:hypothetical protein
MRHFRFLLPLFCITLLYWGCQKSDTPSSHSSSLANVTVNTVTIYSPEHVVVNSVASDTAITSINSLANLLKAATTKETDGTNTVPLPPTATYDGYTKTYNCTSNTWTYVFAWEAIIAAVDGAPAGTGSLTVGTYSTSAAMVIVGTASETLPPLNTNYTKYYIHVTLTVPNDANYCNSTTLQEMLSYSYTTPPPRGGIGPGKIYGAGSNSESADPNVYQTYSDLVGGSYSNGNGTYELEVTPGVLACGTACHISALGFPPTVTFYYHLVGSSAAWSSYSQAGTDLNGFNIQVSQSGTWEYYTQEETAPGVTSGELSYGTISVH